MRPKQTWPIEVNSFSYCRCYLSLKSIFMQIRSHAQKYFLKVQKNGTGEHVPPPRPKRKSAQPYPQKAPKCGTVFFIYSYVEM